MTNYEKSLTLWKQKNPQTDAELAEALNGHSIIYAYHSGKIENDRITYNDTREIFDHDGVSAYTGDLRTLFEIRNSKDANELLLSSFGARQPIDEALIKEFQKQLTKNTYDTRRYQLGERPGEYKRHDYVTGKNEIGAAPIEVAAEITELLGEVQEVGDSDALTAAAYFHAKFENIHPFADGNGRAGRLIMNYFLLLHQHPPIIIHEEDRKQYYDALEKWDTEQVLSPLVAFLREQTEKTWLRQIERMEQASTKVTITDAPPPRMTDRLAVADTQSERQNRTRTNEHPRDRE